jgi:plasmid stabilization system protein ParE
MKRPGFGRSSKGPYRIIYYIKPGQIDVLAVIHGAQDVRGSE